MVANVLERHGISQEDWEQSQKLDYWVDPLNPSTWEVRRPPGQHLATLEGAPVAEWRTEVDITAMSCLGNSQHWQKARLKLVATAARSCTSNISN